MYVTPRRYRSLGTGVDLSGKTDAELTATLEAASSMVNSAVNAPNGYSFLGGSVTEEEHQWAVGNQYKPASGRLWPYMRPVTAVTQVRINVTRTQFITFAEDQLFTQYDIGYTEPVAAPNTTALFTSVPPWLLTSPVAYIDYTYGFHQVASNELMATESGGDLRGAHQFWFTDEDVVLLKNGALVDTADYDIDYDEGIITPDTPDESAVWKVSYHYKLPPGIAAATTLVATDMLGQSAIAAAGMLGLSGIKVEEVELRQSSKINFYTTPVNTAAQVYLVPYRAMFTVMR